jgi:hypothetical protein
VNLGSVKIRVDSGNRRKLVASLHLLQARDLISHFRRHQSRFRVELDAVFGIYSGLAFLMRVFSQKGK